MSDHYCPSCHEPNPMESSRCRNCGASLASRAVVVPQRSPIMLSRPQWPAPPLKTIGVSVALGAVVILVDASIRFIRSRIHLNGTLRPLTGRRLQPLVRETRLEETNSKGNRVVTVFSERVIEERRWGRPVRRIVDRLAWRSEESLSS